MSSTLHELLQSSLLWPKNCKYLEEGTEDDPFQTKFLYHDSGKKKGLKGGKKIGKKRDKHRILVYTTAENIQKLIKCKKLLSDGTFKVPRKLFSQVRNLPYARHHNPLSIINRGFLSTNRSAV